MREREAKRAKKPTIGTFYQKHWPKERKQNEELEQVRSTN